MGKKVIRSKLVV